MDRLRYPIAVLMVAAAVIFSLYILSPILDPGYSAGGDDPVHISYDLELKKILEEEGKVFGWSYLYGTGAPIFIFRPPGFYLASVLLHEGSLGMIPLETGHKAVYLLALALFPVAVFYLMRRFDFPPLACAGAALFSLGPVSTWGHTIDAYFDLGLAKQALALLFVPFTLGKAHGVMRRGDAVFTGSVLFGITFLNHPYMAMSVAWLIGLYLVLHLFSFSLRETVRAAARAAVMMAVGLLLISFWLVPFYSSPEIHPTTGYLSQSRHGFSVMTDTAAGVLDHFFDGSLFDSPNPEPFGAGSVWAWRDNSGTGRWPALTWACLVGLVFLLLGFRYFGNLFFLCGFVFSLLVFMGPDDLPVLRSIPFQEQFQYIHWIPVPELFCVCSAGFGLYSLAALGAAGARALAGGRGRWPSAVFWVSGAVLVGVFAGPVWKDRLEWGGRKVRTRDFETRGGVQTPFSLRSPPNLEFQRCLDLLGGTAPFSRFYASPTSIRSGQEIFYFTVAPALSGRTDVISPLFSGLMGGWNRIIGSTIRRDLWSSRNLVDLLNIQMTLTHRDNLEKFEPEPEFMETAFSGNIWVARNVTDPPGAFGFTGSRPVLAYLGYRDWERTMESWIRYFRDLPRPERAAYVLRAPAGADPGEVEGVPVGEFSALLVAGGTAWDTPAARGLLARARDNGLEIFALSPIPGDPAGVTATDPDGIPFARFEAPPVAWNRERVEEERERHLVAFDCAGPGWLYLKTAYYRGWRASLNGQRAPVLCLSPGYDAVRVGPGASELVFAYAGANHAGLGYLVSGLALLGGIVSLARRRRR